MMGLRLLLERRGLAISAALQHSQTLVEELTEMRVKLSSSGKEQYAAPSGKHDDLAFAVALAVWTVNNSFPHEPAGDDRYCINPEAIAAPQNKPRAPQGRLCF